MSEKLDWDAPCIVVTADAHAGTSVSGDGRDLDQAVEDARWVGESNLRER